MKFRELFSDLTFKWNALDRSYGKPFNIDINSATRGTTNSQSVIIFSHPRLCPKDSKGLVDEIIRRELQMRSVIFRQYLISP